MTTCCYFHPDRPATHTDSVVDLDPPRQYGAADGRGYSSDTSYKRVGICTMCAMERSAQSTSRVEPINQEIGEGFQPMRPCLDGCGTKVDAADGLCETCRRIRSGSCGWDLTRSSSGTLEDQVRYGRPEDPYTKAATAELERRTARYPMQIAAERCPPRE